MVKMFWYMVNSLKRILFKCPTCKGFGFIEGGKLSGDVYWNQKCPRCNKDD